MYVSEKKNCFGILYLVYFKNLPKVELILFVSAREITPFENVSVFTLIGAVD